MRIFIALDIAPEIRHKIAIFMEGVKGFAPEARWVRPESLHVTLKFIGEQSSDAVEQIKHQLSGIRSAVVTVSFRGYGFFPSSTSPRVFWVGIDAGADLAALAQRVEEALHGVPREQHPYNPHLTLARDGARSGSPRRQKDDLRHSRFHLLQQRLQALQLLEFGSMTADAFFLYQSQTEPGGSKYTKLSRFPLVQGRQNQQESGSSAILS